MISEAVDVYVSCSYLLVPSADVLSFRFNQLISSCQRNWRLLAFLKATCRLDYFMLNVFGCQQGHEESFWTNSILNDRFCQQHSNETKTAVDSSSMIRFIFELAFTTSDTRSDVSLIFKQGAAS
jgi:hypothetical protein